MTEMSAEKDRRCSAAPLLRVATHPHALLKGAKDITDEGLPVSKVVPDIDAAPLRGRSA